MCAASSRNCEKPLEGAFLHYFPLLSFKFRSFQWPRLNKNPPAAIFSSPESEIAPSENFSENHEKGNPFRIRSGIWEVLPIERLPWFFHSQGIFPNPIQDTKSFSIENLFLNCQLCFIFHILPAKKKTGKRIMWKQSVD